MGAGEAARALLKMASCAGEGDHLLDSPSLQVAVINMLCRSDELSLIKRESQQKELEHAEALQQLQQKMELQQSQLSKERAKQQSLEELLRTMQLRAEAADSKTRCAFELACAGG